MNIEVKDEDLKNESNMPLLTRIVLLEQENQQLKSTLEEIRELLLNFNNGVCIKDGKEKPAFTKALDFDETRNLLWNLLQIIDRGVNKNE